MINKTPCYWQASGSWALNLISLSTLTHTVSRNHFLRVSSLQNDKVLILKRCFLGWRGTDLLIVLALGEVASWRNSKPLNRTSPTKGREFQKSGFDGMLRSQSGEDLEWINIHMLSMIIKYSWEKGNYRLRHFGGSGSLRYGCSPKESSSENVAFGKGKSLVEITIIKHEFMNFLDWLILSLVVELFCFFHQDVLEQLVADFQHGVFVDMFLFISSK